MTVETILIIWIAQYLIIIPIVSLLILLFAVPYEKKLELISVSILSFPLALIAAKVAGKFIFSPRPFVVLHTTPLFPHAISNGFPSDHTLLAMTVAATVFVANRKLGMVLMFIGLVIGYARIAALVHHPLDIIGATIIAFAAVFFGYLITQNIMQPFVLKHIHKETK